MRSSFIDAKYFSDQCNEIFGLDMSVYPDVTKTLDEYGNGNKIDATNVFFTNGKEDPWKWVTQLQNRPDINQMSVMSECDGCGHCCELYTPEASDPTELKNTRQQVYDWLADILGKPKSVQMMQ